MLCVSPCPRGLCDRFAYVCTFTQPERSGSAAERGLCALGVSESRAAINGETIMGPALSAAAAFWQFGRGRGRHMELFDQ